MLIIYCLYIGTCIFYFVNFYDDFLFLANINYIIFHVKPIHNKSTDHIYLIFYLKYRYLHKRIKLRNSILMLTNPKLLNGSVKINEIMKFDFKDDRWYFLRNHIYIWLKNKYLYIFKNTNQ